MISRIQQSSLDKGFFLEKAPYKGLTNGKKINFKDKIIHKPWGCEYLFYAGNLVEIWYLSINYLKATSLHCHPNKKTALLILEGRAIFSTLDRTIELSPSDGLIISPGAFHSTKATSLEGVKLLEFESPPMKYDLLRIEDDYGRVNQGYEHKNFTKINGNHVRLLDGEFNNEKKIHSNNIALYHLGNYKDLEKVLLKKPKVISILNGNIVLRGSQKYSTCDMLDVQNLLDHNFDVNDSIILSVSSVNQIWGQ